MLAAIVLAFFAVPIGGATDQVEALVIKLKSGKVITYPLSEIKSITFASIKAPAAKPPATKPQGLLETPSPPKPTPSYNQQHSSNQCVATTKKGSRCKRTASPGSSYCWQHK